MNAQEITEKLQKKATELEGEDLELIIVKKSGEMVLMDVSTTAQKIIKLLKLFAK